MAMKLLRETIRRIILTEGMVTAGQLPKNIGVCIEFKRADSAVHVKYCELGEDGTISKDLGFEIMERNDRPPIYGEIKAREIRNKDNCGGAWEVTNAETASGYGPLLYDITMEVATIKGSGLVSDRKTVSIEAHDVWQFYLDNRRDVNVFQCDDRRNSLTPDPSDNIDQRIAKNAYGYDTTEWTNHQLSKRYSKDPTTIEALGDRIKWL